MPTIGRRVSGFATTIFAEMSTLARELGAINLGQGFPDFDGPPAVLMAAVHALTTEQNQYAPGIGMLVVREAIARHANHFYGQSLDPNTQVLVTAGATEAMFAAILGLTEPGDEVICFAPTYDSYIGNLAMAGVTARYVYLNPPNWTFDPDELAAAFTPRTRAIIINTPHNPTGKVFSRDEFAEISRLCQRNEVVAITDEVYEHLVYDGQAHVRLATIPGMEDRTLTISSMGKTFSVTGWKIGWAVGPRDLVRAVNQAHQFITYCVASPLQAAVVAALTLPDSFFDGVRAEFEAKRNTMLDVLARAGFQVLKPQGGYFVIADWRGVAPASVEDDAQFARWLIREVGVACIPPSAFYIEGEKHRVKHLARFAFCKKDETIRAAAAKLEQLRIGERG